MLKIIKFSKRFYSIEVIEKAKEDFKEICEVQIEKSDKYILVKIDPKKNLETRKIELEFSNYSLGLMK